MKKYMTCIVFNKSWFLRNFPLKINHLKTNCPFVQIIMSTTACICECKKKFASKYVT